MNLSRPARIILGILATIFLIGLVYGLLVWRSVPKEAPPPPKTPRQIAREGAKAAREQRIIKAIEHMALQAKQPRPVKCQPPFFDGEGEPILSYTLRDGGEKVVCWARGVEHDPLTGELVEEIDEATLKDKAIAPRIFAQYAQKTESIPEAEPCPPTPAPTTTPPSVTPATTPPTPPKQHHRKKVTRGNDCNGEECGRGPVVYGNADACGSECARPPFAPPQVDRFPQIR